MVLVDMCGSETSSYLSIKWRSFRALGGTPFLIPVLNWILTLCLNKVNKAML